MSLDVWMLTGAAGVGKSSVMKALQEDPPEFFRFMGSVTRDFYAVEGIDGEASKMAMPEAEQVDFQRRLFAHYIDSLQRSIYGAINSGASVLIVDRSPADYLAWTLYSGQFLLTLSDIEELVAEAISFMSSFEEQEVLFNLVTFPYPASWSAETADTEGPRMNTPAKNYLLGATVEHLTTVFEDQCPNVLVIESDPEDTADNRARVLESMIMEVASTSPELTGEDGD